MISVEARIHEGLMVKEELDEILKEAGVNLEVIQKYGALCLNVESGREIAGVAGYHPSKLVAVEPDDGTQRARNNQKVLAELASHFNASVRIEEDFTAIKELRKQKQQFGLITNLNIFPDQISSIGEGFLNNAKEIIPPGGLILTSVAEEEYGSYLDDIRKKGVPGLKLDILEREYGVAGTFILTARKL